MLASSLSILFSKNKRIVACDCDVDAPNLGLWLGTTDWDKSEKISTSFKAKIDQNKCNKCGKCKDICRFFSIEKNDDKFVVNNFLCEGCGACQLICPVNAIEIKPVKNGELRQKKTEYGFPLVSGQLYPGEAGSGKIVERGRKALETSDTPEIGALMAMNQCCLEILGVSTPRLRNLINAALSAGAEGAKITGAGGGGSIIALTPYQREEVQYRIQRGGGLSIPVNIDTSGVQVFSSG